jgi:hypothetical protein
MAWLLFKLAADLGVIHVMLVLQTYKIQELWCHGGFHTDFKGNPGGQPICNRVWIPAGHSREGVKIWGWRLSYNGVTRMLEILGLPKSILTHIMISCVQDTKHETTRFSIFPSGLWSCFGPILPCYSCFLHFGMEMFTLCYCILGYVTCFLFYKGSQLRLCLKY